MAFDFLESQEKRGNNEAQFDRRSTVGSASSSPYDFTSTSASKNREGEIHPPSASDLAKTPDFQKISEFIASKRSLFYEQYLDWEAVSSEVLTAATAVAAPDDSGIVRYVPIPDEKSWEELVDKFMSYLVTEAQRSFTASERNYISSTVRDSLGIPRSPRIIMMMAGATNPEEDKLYVIPVESMDSVRIDPSSGELEIESPTEGVLFRDGISGAAMERYRRLFAIEEIPAHP